MTMLSAKRPNQAVGFLTGEVRRIAAASEQMQLDGGRGVKLLIRWVIVAITLFASVAALPGIRVEDTNTWIAVGVMAVVLGLVDDQELLREHRS
jgi:hypothetical protein